MAILCSFFIDLIQKLGWGGAFLLTHKIFFNDCFTIHVFRYMGVKQDVLLTHGDSIDKVADGFKVVGTSGNIIAAIANDKLRLYGVQFHPEVSWILMIEKKIMDNLVGSLFVCYA